MTENTADGAGSATFADPKRQRRIIFLVLAVLLVAGAVVGVIVFDNNKASAQAKSKADALVANLKEAGLPAPGVEQIEQTLGTDGGAVCADPTNELREGIRNALGSNGASGPGQRPVPIDKDTVAGEALILQVYCPDKLPAFVKYVRGLDLEETVKS